MYKDFETKNNKMVGGSIISYWSKTIVEFDKIDDIRQIKLVKHKSKKEGEIKYFDINDKGLFEIFKT